MTTDKPLSSEHQIEIATGIVLCLVTCGFYNIYWNYRQFLAMNQLLGREEYKFVPWLLLSLVTCGLYHIYYEYKMGSDLYNWLKENGRDANPNLRSCRPRCSWPAGSLPAWRSRRRNP